MIDGLKLSMTGEEVIRLLNDRMMRYDARIRFNRAEIEGTVDPPREPCSDVPVEMVESEIRRHEHRIRLLTIVRNHIISTETYLLGKEDMDFGELFPDPPADARQWDLEKSHTRWIPRSIAIPWDRC